MSVLRPNTIILSAQSVRPIQTSIVSDGNGTVLVSRQTITDYDSLLTDDDDILEDEAPRKRRRLTFLSPEEKLVRRKLKNRVAAQTARDRKKQRMSELEEALASLQAKNAKLAAENDALRQSSSSLVDENSQLRKRLEMPMSEGAGGDKSVVKSEPAVLSTPLQWEPTRTTFQLATYCVTFLALLSLMCSNSMRPSSSRGRLQKDAQTETGCASQLMKRRRSLMPKWHRPQPLPKWWGRHQHSWNPATN